MPAELSGSGATVGVLWRDAVLMAIEDVNAKGGIQGHMLHATPYDTQTNPSVSRAVIQQALDGHPFAVLGPVYSGSVIVDEALTQAAGVTEIMGGEADNLTSRGDPLLFRTSLAQWQTIPPIIDYLVNTVHAKKRGRLLGERRFRQGRARSVRRRRQEGRRRRRADIPSEVGQVSFAPDLLKLRAANVDAVFLYGHEEENARFLKGFRQMGMKAALVGGSTDGGRSDDQTGRRRGRRRRHLLRHLPQLAGAGGAGLRQALRRQVPHLPRPQLDQGLHGGVDVEGGGGQDGRRDPRASAPLCTA